jgi:hypothetical protein
MRDLVFDKGLPASLESERMLLGSVELGHGDMDAIEAVLSPDDFSLEKHRRILTRMLDLHRRGDSIDYLTLFNELKRHGDAESCDGLGLPHGSNERPAADSQSGCAYPNYPGEGYLRDAARSPIGGAPLPATRADG